MGDSRKHSWTSDRIDELKRRWANGESCSQIAHALGSVTRSAVIGKVYRLGLGDRAKVPARSRVAARGSVGGTVRGQEVRAINAKERSRARSPEHKPGRVKNSTLTGQIVTGESKPADARPLTSDIWAPLPGSDPVKIEDHKNGCRFPVDYPGEDIARFCNEPAMEGSPYCCHHAPFQIKPR